MPINQPSNQIKLTNVSVVKLKKGGKRFEIACYKNKVQEWRTGVETDIDDVLQIANIFTNVSKGELAKSGDLKKAFGKNDTNEIVKEILKNGELQVGEKEREHELANIRKDIANRVTESVVDPATQRPYPQGVVEKAMAEVGFNVKPNKAVKSMVLECIHLLQERSKLPIQRARMRVRVTLPREKDSEGLRERILSSADVVEQTDEGEEAWEATLLIDPGKLRIYRELLDKECNAGRVDTLHHTVTADPSTSTS